MFDWIKRIINKDSSTKLKGVAENKYYIEKYKDFDKIIATMY